MIHFDIEKLEVELSELEKKTLEPNFWDDTNNANSILDKIKNIKNKCKKYREIEADLSGIKDIIDLLKIEYDESLANEMIKDINKIKKEVEKFEIQTLLSGKYDKNNAILTIHPGAGGTEAQDWAEMLYRMYTRWATKSGYKVEELDYLEGDEAGLKSVTFEVSGAITGIAIIVNARINYFRYRNGEISYYSMFARDGVTLIEAAIARAPYGIGVIPSIALTAYDIGGGFEQTLYNDAWVKAQIHYWNQQLYQYRPDPGYQPIYYRHGK